MFTADSALSPSMGGIPLCVCVFVEWGRGEGQVKHIPLRE